MQLPSENHENLERAIHQALRELPLRRAPRTLESRVRAEIERRAALPWWRKSFLHWPLGARIAFIALSGGVAVLALLVGVRGMEILNLTQLQAAFATPLGWLEALRTIAEALGSSVAAVLRTLPPLWLYGGVAILGAMYAALFGLGAAAYRTLYADR